MQNLSLVASIACLVDCFAIPAVMAVLPLVGVHNVVHGLSDQSLAILMLCICMPAIVPGFLIHRKARVLVLLAIGLAFVFLANFLGEGLDKGLHVSLTLLGSICLVKANLDNRRLAKTVSKGKCCSHH